MRWRYTFYEGFSLESKFSLYNFNMTLSIQIARYSAQEQGGGAELATASEHRQHSNWVNIAGKVGR